MNRPQILSQLEALDAQIASKQKVLHEFQVRLADISRLEAARVQVSSAKATEADLRGRLRDTELADKTLDEKLQQVNQRLYSGRVTNPKELEGLEQDAEMVKHQRSEVDDKLLDLMAQVERAEVELHERQKQFEQANAERAREVEMLERETAENKKQLAHLMQQRDEWRAKIPASDLSVYDQLASDKNGHATAKIKGAACSVCRVDVPSGLKARVQVGEELVFCANCGRILVG